MPVSSRTFSTEREGVLAMISQRSFNLGFKLGISRYETKAEDEGLPVGGIGIGRELLLWWCFLWWLRSIMVVEEEEESSRCDRFRSFLMVFC